MISLRRMSRFGFTFAQSRIRTQLRQGAIDLQVRVEPRKFRASLFSYTYRGTGTFFVYNTLLLHHIVDFHSFDDESVFVKNVCSEAISGCKYTARSGETGDSLGIKRLKERRLSSQRPVATPP